MTGIAIKTHCTSLPFEISLWGRTINDDQTEIHGQWQAAGVSTRERSQNGGRPVHKVCEEQALRSSAGLKSGIRSRTQRHATRPYTEITGWKRRTHAISIDLAGKSKETERNNQLRVDGLQRSIQGLFSEPYTHCSVRKAVNGYLRGVDGGPDGIRKRREESRV